MLFKLGKLYNDHGIKIVSEYKICAYYLSSMKRNLIGFPVALRKTMLYAYISSFAEYWLPPLILGGGTNNIDAI